MRDGISSLSLCNPLVEIHRSSIVHRVDPDLVVVVPASCAAALINFFNAANAHARVVAHGHRLLVRDLEVASSVKASSGRVVVHATLKVLRRALGAISGATPDIGKTLNITDESQGEIIWLVRVTVAGGAPVNGVSWE